MRTNWTLIDFERSQFMKKINNEIFEFKEFDKEKRRWVKIVIDLKKYKKQEIEDIFSEFYSSSSNKIINEYEKIHKKESTWIIAECIFQKESGLY